MKIWCQPRTDSRSIIVYLAVRAGSRYEDEINNGISHFVEHMVFTGTEKWGENEIKNFITRRGGKWNGYTGKENTYYYAEVSSEDLEYALEWISQIVFHPTFPGGKVEKERNVIFQERWGKYGWIVTILDRLGLGYNIYEKIEQAIYPDDPLNMRTIGEDEPLGRMRREELVDYYRKFYLSNNMHLIVVGGIQPERVLGQAEAFFGDQPGGELPAAPQTPEMPENGPQRVMIRGPQVTDQCIVITGFRNDGYYSRDHWALDVLAEILGKRLEEDIRFEKGLAYGIWSYNRWYGDAGSFAVHTRIDGADRDTVLDIINAHIDAVRCGDIGEIELSEAKTALKGRWALSMEDNFERAKWLEKWMDSTAGNGPVPEYNQLVDAVAIDDLVRVLNVYAVPRRSFLALHVPILTVNSGALYLAIIVSIIIVSLIVRGLCRRRRGHSVT